MIEFRSHMRVSPKMIALALVVLAVWAVPAGAALIADSEADWDTYRNDGLDLGGNPVAPGSKNDAVPQGHADSSGSGSWLYGYYDTSEPTVDPATFTQLPFWENGDTAPAHLQQGFWGLTEGGGVQSHQLRVDGASQHPSFTGGQYDSDWVVRRWVSGVAREVTVSGTVQRPSDVTDPGSTGITAMFFLDGTELTGESISIDLGDTTIYPYSFEATVVPGSTIDFVGDDRGDTSGDLINFSATVTPEPAGGLLMLLSICALLVRRGGRESEEL
jgi:hypothetical protein